MQTKLINHPYYSDFANIVIVEEKEAEKLRADFLFYNQDKALDFKEKLDALITKLSIHDPLAFFQNKEYISLVEEYEKSKKEYLEALKGSAWYSASEKEWEGIETFSYTRETGTTPLPAYLFQPGLCIVRMFNQQQNHVFYGIQSIVRKRIVSRVPSFQAALLLCEQIKDMENWMEKSQVIQKETNAVILNFKSRMFVGEKPDENTYIKKDQTEMDYEAFLNKELDRLTGLDAIKHALNQLVYRLRGERKLLEQGYNIIQQTNFHFTFSGPSGTGKTDVSKILATLFNKTGDLSKSSITVARKENLQPRTIQKTLENFTDGVFVIEEAFSVFNDKKEGPQMVNLLMDKMDKDLKIVMILNDNKTNIDQLFALYPALKTRFTYILDFKDFTIDELVEMTIKDLEKAGYEAGECHAVLYEAIQKNAKHDGTIEGNARWVTSFAKKIIFHLLIRTFKESANEDLSVIKPIDVQKAGGLITEEADEKRLLALRETCLSELNEMVGLREIKDQIEELFKFLFIEKKRKDKGIQTQKPCIHMIFDGAPGTGKTTVARLLSSILKSIHWLETGHLVEVSRSDLVAQYLGQTAPKVKEAFAKAKGGVLFIDEAYSLAQDHFGEEAINEIIKEMEDKREDLVVVLAGYTEDIDRLMKKNSGFSSRIPYRFHFSNYSTEEIIDIVTRSVKKQHYELDDTALDELKTYSYSKKMLDGNGRFARNLVEKIKLEQSKRLYQEESDDLQIIKKEDIKNALLDIQKQENNHETKTIGFV